MLTEDEIAELDSRLRLAMELGTEVTVTWFKPDAKKAEAATSPPQVISNWRMS